MFVTFHFPEIMNCVRPARRTTKFIYYHFLFFLNIVQGAETVLAPPLQHNYEVERVPILFPHPVDVHMYIFHFLCRYLALFRLPKSAVVRDPLRGL